MRSEWTASPLNRGHLLRREGAGGSDNDIADPGCIAN